jgi:hypothetical protein
MLAHEALPLRRRGRRTVIRVINERYPDLTGQCLPILA